MTTIAAWAALTVLDLACWFGVYELVRALV